MGSVITMILIVLLIILVLINVRIVPQEHAYIIERLGKFKSVWYAGLHVKIPFIDQIVNKISLKEQVFDFPPQPVITKDNVSVKVDSVVFSKVFDPQKYTYGVENPIAGLQNLSATTLRRTSARILQRELWFKEVRIMTVRFTMEKATKNTIRFTEKLENGVRALFESDAYKAYLRIETEMSLIDSYAENFGSDLDDLENEQKNDTMTEYHPKEYFSDDFVPTMSEYAQTILKECHYSDLLKATFNFTKFDIMVNGEDKGTSHGKGYRSYLNTVMILMIRKYLATFAKFDPHTFIIDTPLHGFDDGVDEGMPESMRSGLYRYFMNHQDEGQLIIIENLDHIPNLDYEGSGATVTTFEKVDEPGKRYGFLNDVK